MTRAVRRWGGKSILLGMAFAANTWAAAPAAVDSNLHTYTVKGYLMVVSVSVNNRGPFDFLVDTGTNTTLIDADLAKELGLKPAGKISLTSLGKSVPVARYLLENMRAGPASVSNLEVLGAPMQQLRALGGNIRGILGMNFLLEFSFLLDYEHQRLELYPFPAQASAPEGFRTHAEINDWRILIPVASPASRKGTWQLELDSGIPQLLVFHARMAPAGKGTDRCQQASCLTQVATNLSRQSADTVRVRDLSIGDIHLEETPAVVLHNDLLNPADPSDGLLPAAWFRSVFFDRTNATVVLSPALSIMAGR
jgi:predicted aspartyl protease